MARHLLSARKMAAVSFLGFSSGLPLALTGSTLQAWMKAENVDLRTIGLFSLVGIPYSFKFIWAPLMDRFVPPILGRRRGWILIAQIALAVTVAFMAFMRPSMAPALTAAIAFLVAFFSASQDIVVDAYKTDVLSEDELGPGAALNIFGYRVAMLFSGAVALSIGKHLSWQVCYWIMALCMGILTLATLFSPEPAVPPQAPKSLKDAVVLPFVEFFKRRGAIEIVIFMILYKLDAIMTVALSTPFLMELGFDLDLIATVNKGIGLLATIAGTLAGGFFMVRLGLKRSLWTFGIIQGASGFSFYVLAKVGHYVPAMVTAVGLENFCSGLGNAAFAAFMMSLCNKRFSATQYALLSSLMAVARVFGSAPSGYLVRALGWEHYYVFSTLIAIPGLLLLTRYPKWTHLQHTKS